MYCQLKILHVNNCMILLLYPYYQMRHEIVNIAAFPKPRESRAFVDYTSCIVVFFYVYTSCIVLYCSYIYTSCIVVFLDRLPTCTPRVLLCRVSCSSCCIVLKLSILILVIVIVRSIVFIIITDFTYWQVQQGPGHLRENDGLVLGMFPHPLVASVILRYTLPLLYGCCCVIIIVLLSCTPITV